MHTPPDLSSMSDDQLTQTLTRLATRLHHPSWSDRDRALMYDVFQAARSELARRRP